MSKRNTFQATFFTVFFGLLAPFLAAQTQMNVTLEPSKDNTIFSEGSESNGQGSYLFAGQTMDGALRRALLHFDLSSIPTQATIQDVVLTLRMNRSIVSSVNVGAHRLTQDWGEGSSNASGQEGAGAPAQSGDATWQQTFYPDQSWTTPGGDFEAVPSATTAVASNGNYQWTGSGLVADVQGYVDGTLDNFGWILIGPETSTSAKRFDSAQASIASNRPKLEVTYLVEDTQPMWADYPIESDGRSVNTMGWLGFIDVGEAPWVYVYKLEGWVYLPEEGVSESGAWTYILK